MQFTKLVGYFILPLHQPLHRIKLLLSDRNRLYFASTIFLILGILYTISVQLAYFKGLGAVVEPFLKIPAEDYYFYQRFYQIPFFFITAILFAGTIRFLAELFQGKGNFIDLFSVICIAQTLPMFITMWLPETVVFVFFPGWEFPVIPDVLRQVIGIFWPLVIIAIGIQQIERLSLFLSLLLMLISSLPMIALMVIFIR